MLVYHLRWQSGTGSTYEVVCSTRVRDTTSSQTLGASYTEVSAPMFCVKAQIVVNNHKRANIVGFLALNCDVYLDRLP
jgi:hypothetical protein